MQNLIRYHLKSLYKPRFFIAYKNLLAQRGFLWALWTSIDLDHEMMTFHFGPKIQLSRLSPLGNGSFRMSQPSPT